MDRKRVHGPETSVPPVLKNVDAQQQKSAAVFDASTKKRADQRALEDIRPICKIALFIVSPPPLTSPVNVFQS